MKPPVGTQLKRNHPILNAARFFILFQEGAGNAINLIDRTQGSFNSGASWGTSSQGKAVQFAATSSNKITWGTYSPIKTSDGISTGDFTVMVWANPISEANARLLVNQRANSVGNAQWRLQANTDATDTTNAGFFVFETYDASANASHVAAKAFVDSNYHQYLGRRTANGSSHDLFIDGGKVASSVLTVRDFSTQQEFCFGELGGLTNIIPYNKSIIYSIGWDRALLDQEIRQLSNDPWCFMTPRRYFFFSPPAAAVGATDTDSYVFGGW